MKRKPKRIQRKRTRGWRMPKNAIYVGRPTKWGNPFTVKAALSITNAVANYRQFILSIGNIEEIAKRELRGKDLACWCPLVDKNGNPVPCHADVLLEIANS